MTKHLCLSLSPKYKVLKKENCIYSSLRDRTNDRFSWPLSQLKHYGFVEIWIIFGKHKCLVKTIFNHVYFGHDRFNHILRVTVMLVISWYWWLKVGDDLWMLATEFRCWYRTLMWKMDVGDQNGLHRHQQLFVVTDTFRLQHPSPTSM